MLGQSSRQTGRRLTQKTLALDFGSENAFQPNTTRLFPLRSRKMQQPSPQKKVKVLKMIEDLKEFQSAQHQKVRGQSESRRLPPEKGKTSAYMTYKRDKQIMRLQHSAKVSYLRSRCMQGREGSDRGRRGSRSATLSPHSQRQRSISKISLVLDRGDKDGKKGSKAKPQPRQFYLKTAQGKKQRLNSWEYESKLKTRLSHRPEQKGSKTETIFRFNEYSDTPFFFTVNQLVPRPGPEAKGFRHSKHQSNCLLEWRRNESSECRPWTSIQSLYEL